MSHSISELLDQLITLLEQERVFLLTGRAGEAAALSEKKVTATSELMSLLDVGQSAGVSFEDEKKITLLNQLAEENGRHFTAVRNGVRSVIERIGRIGSDTHVGAYNQHGAEVPFSGALGGYLKKV